MPGTQQRVSNSDDWNTADAVLVKT
jgi:hypothetical protein